MNKYWMMVLSLMAGASIVMAEDAAAPKTKTTKAAPAAKAKADAPAAKADVSADAKVLAAADAARTDAKGVTWTLAVEEKDSKDSLEVKARGGDFLAVYAKPSKAAGEKILMKELNMWFKKADVAKPVPISPRQRLLGAASYADIASCGYSVNYKAKKLADEGDNSVFDLTAKTPKAAYDKIKLFVSKKDSTAVKAVYESTEGKALKTATFEYANKAGDRPFISKMTIVDKEDTTTLIYTDVKVGEVSADMFSEASL